MPEPLFLIGPKHDDMPDIGFVFEPHPHEPFSDGDVPVPRSFFTYWIPPPPLADFVDAIWFYRSAASVRVRERVLPTGTMNLVVDLRDDTRDPLVCGAHSESYVVDAADQTSLVGVHFKPGGAFPFLNLPAGELHNSHVSLNTLWGSQADALRERLLETKTLADKFRVLEQALLAQAIRPLARHPAVAFALGEFQGGTHAPTVGDVTEHIGLSARRFIQVFTEEVGLTPKLYCRVRRFQEVLRLVRRTWNYLPSCDALPSEMPLLRGVKSDARRGQRVEWADVALDCGYYDQAHLIHDFRAFSGLTPTAYLQVWGEHLNYGACWTG